MNKQVLKQKEILVEQLSDKLKNSNLTTFVDYKGLTVSQMTDLRLKINTSQGQMAVYKNTLIKRALNNVNVTVSDELLKGPTLIINTTSSPTEVSKVIIKSLTEIESMSLKGAVFNDEEVDPTIIQQLSKIPSRDVLIATLIGSMKSPLVGLVRTLSSPVSGLINVLRAIKSKKSGGEQ